MNIRESMEQRERELLSPYASHSADTRGREHPEEECDVRTTYQRDRDRILHCKAFRRMKDKTQVFLAPQGDHYRTRLTHTLEVSQIARTIAKALRLNEDLVEAIALGHDLGHTPFGHAGCYFHTVLHVLFLFSAMYSCQTDIRTPPSQPAHHLSYINNNAIRLCAFYIFPHFRYLRKCFIHTEQGIIPPCHV